MARTTKFDRRQNDGFFFCFSPIKSPSSFRRSKKKNLEITKSILYINFVNRKLEIAETRNKINKSKIFPKSKVST
jgi:hypothetical protein